MKSFLLTISLTTAILTIYTGAAIYLMPAVLALVFVGVVAVVETSESKK